MSSLGEGTVGPSAQPVPRSVVAGVAITLALVALWALPRTIQAGDAGELSTVMLRGGIPHPSGYPWMRVLGGLARILLVLPISPAMAAALPCAAAGVAGWTLLVAPLARVTTTVAAVAAIGIVAVSPTVVLHTADAEVWGPLVLAAAVVVRLCLRGGVHPGWLGLAIGAAVSHHLTAVLLVPCVVAAAWPSGAGSRDVVAIARAAGWGLLGSAAGLTMYLTLMVGDDGAWRWGHPETFAGLWHHVTRADYGAWSLSLHETPVSVTAQWSRALASLGAASTAGLASTWWLGALVLVGLVAAAWGPARARLGARALGLGTAAALSALGLPAAFNLDPSSPFAAWILERFDVLTLVLLTVPLALAIDRGLRRLDRARPRAVATAALAVLALANLARSAAHGMPSADDVVQRYAVAVLRSPPPDRTAIVFGTDDHRTFPVLFAQQVLGEGGHVLYVDASLLAHPWYREALRQRVPWLPDRDKPLALVGALYEDAEHRDTPVYLANVFSRPASQVPRVPEGVLWRIVGPHGPPPDADAVVAAHEAAIDRIGDAPSPTDAPGHPWSRDLAAAFVEGHGQVVQALLREGRTSQADALAQRWGRTP